MGRSCQRRRGQREPVRWGSNSWLNLGRVGLGDDCRAVQRNASFNWSAFGIRLCCDTEHKFMCQPLIVRPNCIDMMLFGVLAAVSFFDGFVILVEFAIGSKHECFLSRRASACGHGALSFA